MLKSFFCLILVSISFSEKGWPGLGAANATPDSPYADEVRKDHPLIYARFEEAEGDDFILIETANGIIQGQFIEPAGYVLRGYPSAWSDLGKATLFRRDPRACASIAAQEASSLGLDFAASSEFTIEAWINPYEIGPFSQSIASLDPAYGSKGYILSLETNGALTFHRLASPGIITSPNTIESGTWSHIAVTVKQQGTESLAMIYVNGVPALAGWVTIASMAPGSGAPFLIGSRNIIEGDYSFVGCIDELAVYDKALTASDLLSHYNTAISSPDYPLTISHGQQMIIDKGLQTQAWVLYGTGLNTQLWNGIHLSTPVIGPQCLTTGVLEGIGKNRWGYNAPQGPLSSDNNFLNISKENLACLFSIQYGDEQDVTQESVLQDASSYFQEVRHLFPDVLVHTNQTGLQLNESQLRNLVQVTQPDLITFDTYFFSSPNQYPGGSLTGIYDRLAKYRKIANRGLDDTSTAPIVFGHFVQGYLSKGSIMSESQVRAQLFSAWTFGAKWICMFWYNFMDNNGLSYLFGGWPDGNPLPGYGYYSLALAETDSLEKALVRLQTTDVYFIPGSFLSNGIRQANPVPSFGVLEWNNGIDPYLKNIEAQNLGTLNNSLPGDLIIGFFRPFDLNGLKAKDNKYFMIFNGLTDYNGNASQTVQKITLTFDFSGTDFTNLLRLDRQSGLPVSVPLENLGNSSFQLEWQLEGGTADLFKIDNGKPFAGF